MQNMILRLLYLFAAAAATEIEFKVKKPGIQGQTAEFNCRYNLGDRILLHLFIYKGPTKNQDNTLIFVGNATNPTESGTIWENPNIPDISTDRIDFELNKDVDDWKIGTLRISDLQLSDKNDYSCVVTTRAADNPVPVSVEKSTNFDIYYPPKNIKFSPTFSENGVMTAKCEVDNSYPEPTFDIPWILENSVTSEEINSENDKIYKTFQYPISPSNANDEISCQVGWSSEMDDPLSATFKISSPRLPENIGNVIEELQIEDYTLNNAALLIDSLDFDNTTGDGIFRISDYSTTVVNDTCSVSMTATAGTIEPTTKIIWFVDNDRKSEGDTFQLDTNRTGNDTLITVIGDSYVGRVALQYNYREGCFPTVAPTVSTTSLVEETLPKSGRAGPDSDITVTETNKTDESLPEGSGFSHDGDVDQAQMSGAIIALIVCSTIAIVLLIGAIIYFLCFSNKEKAVYKPKDKGLGDSEVDDITASIDMNDVVQTKSDNSVKRTLSGTWHKPSEEASLLQTNNNSNKASTGKDPKRTVSTQTLEGHVDTEVTLKESAEYGSTRSVHV